VSLKQQLLDNNYLVIKNFITKEKAQYLNDWLINEKNHSRLRQDARFNIGLYAQVCSNGIPFLELLCEKINQVSDLIEEKVLPTYTYSVIYENKSNLSRHTDRDACEVSITVHLSGDKKWDLGIQKPNGDEIKIDLDVGDALLYLGCKAIHWRDGLYQGKNYTQTMLHYVKSNGLNAWAFFDKHERLK
jgi:hypothetical protein